MTHELIALMPADVPRLAGTHVNASVLLFVLAVAGATVVTVAWTSVRQGVPRSHQALHLGATRMTPRLDGRRLVTAELAIGVVLGGSLAMSTKADGTCAGTCDAGFASSISVTPKPFALLTNPDVLKVLSTTVTPTAAALSVVSTDGFTFKAHCHP